MKTRNCDFSGKEYPEENNISATLQFRSAEGKFYKAELDISPTSFVNLIAKNSVRKPFPFEEFVPFTEAQLAEYKMKSPNGKRKGTYKPANVVPIIASLIEETASV